jgi:hypothetical protein
MPTLTREGQVLILDEEGDPLEEDWEYDPATFLHLLDLWQPALIEGETYEPGLTPLEIYAPFIRHRKPTYGGDLTHWLLPRAVELEQEANPQADGKQAYGWLPPPLMGEGSKVQSDWLHDFLLEPYAIRPAALMRMPKFNLSSREATQLVHYFAAKDRAEYPYRYSRRTQAGYLKAAQEAYEQSLQDVPEADRPFGETRLAHAMNIVVGGDYCVKCHLVGQYSPEGDDRAKAPDLSLVYRRLRPDYVRRWTANPPQLLPYTPMPVNINYDANAPFLGGVDQSLFHGSSIQQVDGLVDLLMNYPRYAERRAPVADLVTAAAERVAAKAATQNAAQDEAPTDPSAEQDESDSDESDSDES